MTVRGIAAIAAAQPGRRALVHDGGVLTYAQLDADINRAAHALHAAGVLPGDRVAVRLPNTPDIFIAQNAAARLGALVVPVSTRLTAAEVNHMLGDSGSVVCIHDDAPTVAAASGGLPQLRALIDCSTLPFEAMPPAPPIAEFLGSPVICMSYTSGTTGRPKGISRRPPAPAAEPPRSPIVDFWGFGGDDVHLLCGPAYHTAPGAYAQMHLVEGAPVVVMRHFDAPTCLGLIAEHGVTTSHMVPANFVRIVEATPEAYELRSIRRILHAAAPCPVALKRRILDVFPPGSVWEYYGASEGMGSAISPEEWLRKPGSVGRAFPGMAVDVLDDEGRRLPPGTVGTIYITPPPGFGFQYHDNPAATAAAHRGEAFTAGDLGWLDEDGYLFIADRRVDLIISGGVNVYCAEVERELAELGDVVDSAVFGLPDARMGQSVHAVIELRPGAVRDPADLVRRLSLRLADYKLPRSIEFVERLPREPNGKVRKQELRAAALEAAPAQGAR